MPCERQIRRDRAGRVRDPARLRAIRHPSPDDFDAIHVLMVFEAGLRFRSHHCDVVTQAHEVAAKIEGMGFQASYFGRKVYALLKDFHVLFFSRKGRKVRKGALRLPCSPLFYFVAFARNISSYFFQSLVLREAPVSSEITISAMRSPALPSP